MWSLGVVSGWWGYCLSHIEVHIPTPLVSVLFGRLIPTYVLSVQFLCKLFFILARIYTYAQQNQFNSSVLVRMNIHIL